MKNKLDKSYVLLYTIESHLGLERDSDELFYEHILKVMGLVSDGHYVRGLVGRDINGLYIDGLHIRGAHTGLHVSEPMASPRNQFRIYGHSVSALYTYERIVKTLRLLNKRLTRVETSRGQARTFGEFIQRACEVVGIEQIMVVVDRTRSSTFSEWKYRSFGSAEADAAVSYQMLAARKLVGRDVL